MATNIHSDDKKHTAKGSRNRALWIALIVLLAALGAAALYFWPSATAYSRTGSAYAARVICSCRYIGERDLNDCEKDLEPGMEIVSVSDDPEARRVTGSVPFLAEESAEFRPGYGCVLMTPEEMDALDD